MRHIVGVALPALLFFAIAKLPLDIGRAGDNPSMKQDRLNENQGRDCVETVHSTTNRYVESVLLSALRRLMVKEMDNPNVDSCVVHFHSEVFMSDAALQNQIQAVLFNQHQKEMAAAVKSSGNIHNPRLTFLYDELKPAMREIPAMKELSQVALSCGYCETIHVLGGEKIQIRRKNLAGEMFLNPDFRIYGITGFSLRKRDSQNKDSLIAEIVDIDKSGNVASCRMCNISRNQYW